MVYRCIAPIHCMICAYTALGPIRLRNRLSYSFMYSKDFACNWLGDTYRICALHGRLLRATAECNRLAVDRRLMTAVSRFRRLDAAAGSGFWWGGDWQIAQILYNLALLFPSSIPPLLLPIPIPLAPHLISLPLPYPLSSLKAGLQRYYPGKFLNCKCSYVGFKDEKWNVFIGKVNLS
jgi:hypothetical protein